MAIFVIFELMFQIVMLLMCIVVSVILFSRELRNAATRKDKAALLKTTARDGLIGIVFAVAVVLTPGYLKSIPLIALVVVAVVLWKKDKELRESCAEGNEKGDTADDDHR